MWIKTKLHFHPIWWWKTNVSEMGPVIVHYGESVFCHYHWSQYSIVLSSPLHHFTWWRHEMETFSALLALCEGNSPVTGEFPSQRPVARSFGVFFDLRLNKRLSKQSWGWWFETPSRSLWHHCNDPHLDALRLDHELSPRARMWRP